jgi:hypothetical protein
VDADGVDADVDAPDEMRPILVGGCSRSGTTLLGAMLSSGDGVITVPEAEFKWAIAPRPGRGFDLARARDRLVRDTKFARWHVNPTPIRAGSYEEFLAALVRLYASSSGRAPARIWVDHTPGNIAHAWTLASLLQSSRFVHVVRDGRAVAASVLPLDWGPSNILEAARYWSGQVGIGLAAEQFLGPARCMRVPYEELVTQPAAVLSRVCAFAGIAFERSMIDERAYRVPRYSRRQHRLVGESPDRERVDAWRNMLSARAVEAFEHQTGDMLALLGYDMEYGVAARPLPKRTHARVVLAGAARRVVLDRVRNAMRSRLP